MKILIAEDELVSRKKLEKLVEMAGHEPLSASNGKEALNLWESAHRETKIGREE